MFNCTNTVEEEIVSKQNWPLSEKWSTRDKKILFNGQWMVKTCSSVKWK